jgi:hypothetical protein
MLTLLTEIMLFELENSSQDPLLYYTAVRRMFPWHRRMGRWTCFSATALGMEGTKNSKIKPPRRRLAVYSFGTKMSAKEQCQGARRWNSQEHRADFARGKISAHLRLSRAGQGKSYPDGVTYWDKQEEIHKNAHAAGQDVHGGPAFLPWRREPCNRLEALLREVDAAVSLHYWD